MVFTLNNLIKILRELAEGHHQINSFQFGDIWEIATDSPPVYPLMFAQTEPSTIEGTRLRLSMRLLFMDLVHKDESNENEVLSDQLQIATDIIAQLKAPDFQDRFIIDTTSIALEDFTERFDDEVTGWSVSVVVVIDYLADRCSVPSDFADTGEGICRPVTIKNTSGVVIATVQSGGTFIVASSNPVTIENSDQSFADTAAAGTTFVLPDIDIKKSTGSVIETIPSVQDYTVADSNIQNSDGSYNVDVPATDPHLLPDSNINKSDGSLIQAIPATTNFNVADSQVRKSDNSLIANVKATENYNVGDSNVRNSTSSYNVNVKATESLILPDITHTDSDGSPIIKPAQVPLVCTLQSKFEYTLNFAAGSFPSNVQSVQIQEKGTIDFSQDTNIATRTIRKNGTIVTVPFAVDENDIVSLEITRTTANDAAAVLLRGSKFDNVVKSQTIPDSGGDGRYGYILNRIDQTVSVLDANSNTIITTITLPAGFAFLRMRYRGVNKGVYIFGNDRLAIIDANPLSGTFNTVITNIALLATGGGVDSINTVVYNYLEDRMFYSIAIFGNIYELNLNTNVATQVINNSIPALSISIRNSAFIPEINSIGIFQTNSNNTFILDNNFRRVKECYYANTNTNNYNALISDRKGSLYGYSAKSGGVVTVFPLKDFSNITNISTNAGSIFGGISIGHDINRLCYVGNAATYGIIDISNNTSIGVGTKSNLAANETRTRTVAYSPFSKKFYLQAANIAGLTTGVDRVHIIDPLQPIGSSYVGFVTVGNMDSTTNGNIQNSWGQIVFNVNL